MPAANIFDIKRFAVHDGPGIRTTVFLKGCPLRCWWCHNPESQSVKPITVDVERKLRGKSVMGKKTYGELVEIEELYGRLERDRLFYEESGGGVTFSGGEPLMQPEALEALLRACESGGLHTTVDTCGFAPREHFEGIVDYTGLFLYDLKNMDAKIHREYAGVDNSLILSNADYLLEKGARVIFRIPVIPGINTGEDELKRFLSYVEERKDHLEEVHLLPYHRIAGNKYSRLKLDQKLEHVKEPGQDFMEALSERFGATGLMISVGG
ncbi:MAG: glycyl-radical enzyme activating protein [Bacteroidetes bacterium]|nr:glycyl-radical enzyme activating protein [Bacteroidota bacterium]